MIGLRVARSKSSLCVALATLLTAPVACTVDVEIGRNNELERSLVLDVPARKKDKLDLLFVVDNSSNMGSRQTRLAEGFTYLVDALREVRGALPDLHVGVVTPDLGAGSFAGQTQCTVDGDRGVMMVPPECAGIDGYFLDTNTYHGDLSEAFACMTALGESGCDYEQPLEAMRRALGGDVLENNGFLRPSAMLGIVFVTDEDDCSANSEGLFDPSTPMLTGDAEWRCFSSGVRCGNDDDVFPPGPQADCFAREDSQYVEGIDQYADFVRDIKSDPAEVVVMGVIGEPSDVTVGLNPNNTLFLESACDDPSGEATFPAVRMGQFLDATREAEAIDNSYASLCSQNTEAGLLGNAANQLRAAMGSTCLRGHVLDVDADTSGWQVDCEVAEVFPDRQEPLLACDNRFAPTQSSFFPCYTIELGNDVCNHEPTRLSLRVVRSANPDPNGLDAPIDSRLRASCVVEDRPVVE